MLTLQQAAVIVDAALAEGRVRSFQPLCVAVLDAGGHLLALKRDERASLLRPAIATGKAAGCLGMGFGGRELARRAAANPAFFTALAPIAANGLVPVIGGVLILDQQGSCIGAVGVSGDLSEHDEICAVAGIVAAGLAAKTGA